VSGPRGLAFEDAVRYAGRSIGSARGRTALMTLAMAIGVAAVIALTALGQGARNYVLGEFLSLGGNILTVFPGRNETTGGRPPTTGATPRPLTLDDALALTRSGLVRRVAPIVVGQAPVSFGNRSRDVTVLGSTAAFKVIRHIDMQRGRFLPGGDPYAAPAVAVLGTNVARELFGTTAPVGQLLRIGDRRFRIIGVMASKGQSLGVDMDDVAVVPVAAAQALFNTESLFRVIVEAQARESIPSAKRTVEAIIAARHEGENDVTVISLDALLDTFDRILSILTLGVAGIAAISLAVAGLLIMNVMLVSVSQRTREIGLLKALGATPRAIARLFLAEATLLSCLGAAAGVAVAWAGITVFNALVPGFPVAAPPWAIVAGAGIAVATGLAFGVLPARRAARLDAVAALAGR